VTLTILVWRFESVHRGYPIHHWYDAAWWAVVTLFTVGYGDLYPRTAEGRVAAVLMMIVGIALFSWITAALASLFVENEGKVGSKTAQKQMMANQEEMVKHLEAIHQRLENIERTHGAVTEESAVLRPEGVEPDEDLTS
jgi:voltage-gated potassium channel